MSPLSPDPVPATPDQKDAVRRRAIALPSERGSEDAAKMDIYAYGLSPDELEALFDRVADAAHALDEQVLCVGFDRSTVTAPPNLTSPPIPSLVVEGNPE